MIRSIACNPLVLIFTQDRIIGLYDFDVEKHVFRLSSGDEGATALHQPGVVPIVGAVHDRDINAAENVLRFAVGSDRSEGAFPPMRVEGETP